MAKQLSCMVHPKEQNQYYTFRDDGVLALYENGKREPLREYRTVEQLLVFEGYEDITTADESGNEKRTQQVNSTLTYDRVYTMEILWPWLSIFQKYGTNGCVYHLETGDIKVFSRENYHANVSGFSNGLLIYHEQVCLLHQSQWNRLDITNLENGELLTDREVYCRQLEETDQYGGRKYEKKNYVDYFHGRVFLSPDYKYFVDTGWVWQPAGVSKLYRVEDFISRYEQSEIWLGAGEEYVYCDDWDQAVVWLDQDRFLLNFFLIWI